MTIEELRIGNWVMGYHDPFQWSLEHFDLLKQADLDEIIKEPVLITEEVLLKCGFEKKSGSFVPTFICKQRRDLLVQVLPEIGSCIFRIESCIFRIEIGMGYPTYVRYVDYLHELQNLYYAITGDELDIKL